MIVGILGGKLASLGASSVVLSGLVVRNLYEPLFPGKSERHYMVVARATVPFMLGLGIIVAIYINNVVSLLKFMITLLVIWGAPITVMFLWRRLTETAVRVQVIATLLFIGIVPWIVSATPSLRRAPSLTVTTQERMVVVTARANAADVAAGRATAPGQEIAKNQRLDPVSVFFEDGVARINPRDLTSPREGVGRFNIEVWLVSRLGVDVTQFSPAVLLTLRYIVDTLLPLLLLIGVSLLTPPTDPARVARFYVRMKTPVGVNLAVDALDVEASYADPTRFDHTKLFPRSNWEFTKWNREDTLGFLGCCALVGFILVFFKGVLMLGA